MCRPCEQALPLRRFSVVPAAILACAAAHVALAQNSGLASNIAPADTRSQVAPPLPSPDVGRDAGPRQYLIDARMALREGRTGAAQEALERAETRLLNHGGAPSPQDAAHAHLLAAATAARGALGAHDAKRAETILDGVLAVRMADAALPPPMEPELAYPPARWVPAHWVWRGGWVMAPGRWQ